MRFYDEFSHAQLLSMKQKLSNKDKHIRNIILVARYYLDCGYTENDTKQSLKDFVARLYEGMNDGFVNETVNKAYKLALERPNLVRKTIDFSTEELDFIFALDNEPLERIVFIMMCIYKSNDCQSFSVSKRFINSETKMNKDMDTLYKLFNMMETSNIFVSKIYQGNIYYYAGEAIESLNSDSTYLSISSKKNIIYYYLDYVNTKYLNEYNNFIFCKNCGCIEKKNKKANNILYCKECSAEIRKLYKREKQRKYREK